MRFKDDGETLTAISRSGEHLKLNLTTGKTSLLGRIIPAPTDKRPRLLIALLTVLFISIPLLIKYRNQDTNQSLPCPAMPRKIFVIILVLEALKWVLLFSSPFAIYQNLMFSFIHISLATTYLIYAISAALFRLPMQWRWTLLSVILVGISGYLDYLITITVFATI